MSETISQWYMAPLEEIAVVIEVDNLPIISRNCVSCRSNICKGSSPTKELAIACREDSLCTCCVLMLLDCCYADATTKSSRISSEYFPPITCSHATIPIYDTVVCDRSPVRWLVHRGLLCIQPPKAGCRYSNSLLWLTHYTSLKISCSGFLFRSKAIASDR